MRIKAFNQLETRGDYYQRLVQTTRAQEEDNIIDEAGAAYTKILTADVTLDEIERPKYSSPKLTMKRHGHL